MENNDNSNADSDSDAEVDNSGVRCVEICGKYASKCGYCKSGGKTGASYGMVGRNITCEDYQNLIDRGWRRCGNFLYQPVMSETCCPQYTIRLEVSSFAPTKSQQRVMHKLRKYAGGGASAQTTSVPQQSNKFAKGAKKSKKNSGKAKLEETLEVDTSTQQLENSITEAVMITTTHLTNEAMVTPDSSPLAVLKHLPCDWQSPEYLRAAAQVKPNRGRPGHSTAIAVKLAAAVRKYLSSEKDNSVTSEQESSNGNGVESGSLTAAHISTAVVERLGPALPPGISAVACSNGFINIYTLADMETALSPALFSHKEKIENTSCGGLNGAHKGTQPHVSKKKTVTQTTDVHKRGSAMKRERDEWNSHTDTGVLRVERGEEPPSKSPDRGIEKLESETLHDKVLEKIEGYFTQNNKRERDGEGSAMSVDRVDEPLPPMLQGAPGLVITTVPASFTEETYQLYRKYQIAVHDDKPEDVKKESYERFLVHTPFVKEGDVPADGVVGDDSLLLPCGAYHQYYRIGGRLVAVGVIDILPRCLSSVYCFYDPAYRALSPGKFVAMCEIEWIQKARLKRPDLTYYYLGFYIQSCPKMRYKGDYRPSEILCPETYKWVPLSKCVAALEKKKYMRISDLLYDRPPPPPMMTTTRPGHAGAYMVPLLVGAPHPVRLTQLTRGYQEMFEEQIGQYYTAVGPTLGQDLPINLSG